MSRTASMISWLMSLPFVDQVAPHDRVVRDVYIVAVDADRDGPFAGVPEFPFEVFAARDLGAGLESDVATDDAPEVLGRAERAGEARRRHLDGVLPEVVAQDVSGPLAERVVDPLGVVDVDRESIRSRELDGQDFGTRYRALHLGA